MRFWDEIEPEIEALRKRIPVVVVGSDPSSWALSSVSPEIVATVYRYILFNGRDNIANMLRFLMHGLFGQGMEYREPEEVPWQGIYHPGGAAVFQDTESYLSWYKDRLGTEPRHFIGVLYPARPGPPITSTLNALSSKLLKDRESASSLCLCTHSKIPDSATSGESRWSSASSPAMESRLFTA